MANESEEVGATRTTQLERVAASVGATRPLVSPDSFSGLSSWAEWIDHFEAVPLVNGCDDEKKQLWLPVRLTGKAQTAWKRLSSETKDDYTKQQRIVTQTFRAR